MIQESENIKIVSWQDERKQVAKINPDLASIIDQLNLSKKHTLIKASYAYGEDIICKGHVQLPSQPNTAKQNNLLSSLSYASIPIGLLMNRASEVFVHSKSNIVPLKLLNPGSMFGVFEVVSYLMGQTTTPIWNVAAGARTLFMLPKIANKKGIKNLRKKYPLPRNLSSDIPDQWQLFNCIGKKEQGKEQWLSDILFFPDVWFEQKNSNHQDWDKFYQFLYRQAWIHSEYSREQTSFEIASQYFADALAKRNLQPCPYLMASLKHLIHISRGIMPAFKPIDNSQIVAPSQQIEQAYLELYGIKNYFPILMHPCNLMDKSVSAAYYSLAFPTLIEGYHDTRNAPANITYLKDLKLIASMYVNHVYSVVESTGSHLITPPSFRYFHNKPDEYGEIENSSDIPSVDSQFNREYLYQEKPYRFCSNSQFWQGCVQILNNN